MSFGTMDEIIPEISKGKKEGERGQETGVGEGDYGKRERGEEKNEGASVLLYKTLEIS